MDLIIEAKDKEQAVFKLMRIFKLPGHDRFNDMLPHIRKDDNKPVKTLKTKAPKKKAAKAEDDTDAAEEYLEADKAAMQDTIADDEVGMGGPEGRVYWPPGIEHWLRPVKKVVKPKEPKGEPKMTPAQKKKVAAEDAAKERVKVEQEVQANGVDDATTTPTPASKEAKAITKSAPKAAKKVTNGTKNGVKSEPTPSTSGEDADGAMSLREEDEVVGRPKNSTANQQAASRRQSARAKKMSYAEDDNDGEV